MNSKPLSLVIYLLSICMIIVFVSCGVTDEDKTEKENNLNECVGDECNQVTIETNVVINEVVAKSSSDAPDWFELYNVGDQDADLSGWSIGDGSDEEDKKYIFPDGTMISSKNHLLVIMDDDFLFGLGKEDSLKLFNKSGDLVNETSWTDGQAPSDNSWGRIPDGTGEFATLYTITPGEPNIENGEIVCGNGILEDNEECDDGNTDNDDGCNSECKNEQQSEPECGNGVLEDNEECDDSNIDSGDGCDSECKMEQVVNSTNIVINEIVAKSSTTEDWIEFLNIGQDEIDISGWSFSDDLQGSNPTPYVFAEGTIITAGEYLKFEKETDFVFGLSKDDSVILYNKENQVVENVSWEDGAAPLDKSFGRIPDGTGEFFTLDTPTPGAQNIENTVN